MANRMKRVSKPFSGGKVKINDALTDHSNDPAIVRKTKVAEELLNRVGPPKNMSK